MKFSSYHTNGSQTGFWIVVSNNLPTKRLLLLEPYGQGWYMLPDEKFYVFLQEAESHYPEIQESEESIQIFASLAVIYRNGERICDYSEIPVPPPLFRQE